MSKVAAIQMTSGHVVADNLEVAARLLRQAKDQGAEIACLPENFAYIGLKDADKLAVAEAPGQGPIQEFLLATARSLGMWVLAGTFPMRGDDPRRVLNASLLFDAAGKLAARYDKIHLFDVSVPGRNEDYRESAMSAVASAVTHEMTDDQLLEMLRHAYSRNGDRTGKASLVRARPNEGSEAGSH